eukprot:scaffold4656_cov29-Tisochrysis_lutea.AAC.3
MGGTLKVALPSKEDHVKVLFLFSLNLPIKYQSTVDLGQKLGRVLITGDNGGLAPPSLPLVASSARVKPADGGLGKGRGSGGVESLLRESSGSIAASSARIA